MESGGVIAEATAAVFRAPMDSVRSLDFELRADSMSETVLERQAFIKMDHVVVHIPWSS